MKTMAFAIITSASILPGVSHPEFWKAEMEEGSVALFLLTAIVAMIEWGIKACQQDQPDAD